MVRHRIDGLENQVIAAGVGVKVRHRIDGLEIAFWQLKPSRVVRHRIDGLETMRYRQPARCTVRHRIDGLENSSISSTPILASSPSHRWFRNLLIATSLKI